MTFKELIYEWLYENHKSEIKKRTLLRYEVSIKTNILPYYGDVDINTITPRDLQKWLNEIKERKSSSTKKVLSPSSINGIIAIFKQSFHYACDFEILPHDPSIKLKRMPIRRDEKVRAFTLGI